MNTQRWFYAALVAVNGALLGATQQGLVPAHYAQYVALVSFALAAFMKEVQGPPAPPPAVAP